MVEWLLGRYITICKSGQFKVDFIDKEASVYVVVVTVKNEAP